MKSLMSYFKKEKQRFVSEVSKYWKRKGKRKRESTVRPKLSQLQKMADFFKFKAHGISQVY